MINDLNLNIFIFILGGTLAHFAQSFTSFTQKQYRIPISIGKQKISATFTWYVFSFQSFLCTLMINTCRVLKNKFNGFTQWKFLLSMVMPSNAALKYLSNLYELNFQTFVVLKLKTPIKLWSVCFSKENLNLNKQV